MNNTRSILALAVPAIVVNITTPLLALMDVAITGHMGSPVYIAAIAVGGAMFNMLYWLFGFLRMGTSGMTAQAYGKANLDESSEVLYRATIIAILVGLTIVVLQHPVSTCVLWFMDCDVATIQPALRYFSICVWGAPAVLTTYVATGWLLGMQNSRAGMWISLIINISNILLSLVLVLAFHLKIEGVAIGTLCAQWLGAIASVFAVRCYPLTPFKWSALFRLHDYKRFFNVNVYIFLRTLCLIVVTMWFTRVGAMQGNVMLAVNTLLMQLFILFSYFLDGFAYAAEALSGRYFGAKDKDGYSAMVRCIFKWGSVLSLVFAALYFIAGDYILSLLSSDTDIINTTHDYMLWAMTVPVVGFAAFLWDGIFIGFTRTRSMFFTMLVATAVFFCLYFMLYNSCGNHGLWIAFCGYLATRSLTLTFCSFKIKI